MLKVSIGYRREPVEGDLETYFRPFRMNTIGINQHFQTPYGQKKILYADWTASGRLYGPIETKMAQDFGPFVANTHSESNITGTTMTRLYKEAKQIIKEHVNADARDVLILDGTGTTSAINKLQRILGLRVPEKFKPKLEIPIEERPIIFVTHMEHHSNEISWRETIGDVVSVKPDASGNVDLQHLEELLLEYQDRKYKIGSFTACSNVTGIRTPYDQLASLMHKYGGICFVDFAASAPYVEMNMHPRSPFEKLDGIFFSPHKFLGGPGTSGVLVLDSRLYSNQVPDHPGGGTVKWTNPWGKHKYAPEIEVREDGGTPGFLQAIRIALCIRLKEHMGIEKILRREEELKDRLLDGMKKIPQVHILESLAKDRLGVVSFTIENIHYNLMVRLLNDRFGIQVRGGCSCAGPYGHYLLQIDPQTSQSIFEEVDHGKLLHKPGWVRISLHPTMTNEEILYILKAVQIIAENGDEWKSEYTYDHERNEYFHLSERKPSYRRLFEMQ